MSALVGAVLGAGLTQRLRPPEVVVREQPADQARGVVGAMYSPVGINALPGWSEDTVVQALPGLKRSCAALKSLAPDAVIGNGPIARPAAAWIVALMACSSEVAGSADVAGVADMGYS